MKEVDRNFERSGTVEDIGGQAEPHGILSKFSRIKPAGVRHEAAKPAC
jgi:hypothetical protein